jgi:predicted nucleotide-binding protein
MFAFLRSLGLEPKEWSKAVFEAKGANPHVDDIIETAMAKVRAVVVMLSPDDEAKLKEEFVQRDERTTEGRLQGQPRPNVILEAGLALGRHSDKTLLVQVGKIKPISDILGKHIVKLTNDVSRRNDVANRLEKIGCKVDRVGNDWTTEGDFDL